MNQSSLIKIPEKWTGTTTHTYLFFIMGCDNYLFKTTIIEDQYDQAKSDYPCNLIKSEKVWHESSWKIGEAFTEHYQIADTNQRIAILPSMMKEFAEELVSEWKKDKDIDEYDCEALEGLIKELHSDEGVGNDITYFFTLWW